MGLFESGRVSSMSKSIDILMITYNRPHYTKMSLQRLIETCDSNSRVRIWLWHNGTDEPTLKVVQSFLNQPCVHKFHHSPINVKLNKPTNWLWENAIGDYFGKVDDDCLMADGWIDTLLRAHEDEPSFGILGCWRHLDEDFIPALANKKIATFRGGHKIMKNCWIAGSGYLMKRECVADMGFLNEKVNFTEYGKLLARRGWIHGWYYPFIFQDHMDDPRSEHSMLRTDADLAEFLPLSAQRSGVTSLAEWQNRLLLSAKELQAAPANPKYYFGWRRKLRGLRNRLLETNSY